MENETVVENTERGFKGIWIPKELWCDDNLTVMEKIFFVEIDSLDNEDGCYASNGHFSRFFNLTPHRCSQIINSLIKKKYVSAEYERKGKQIIKRTLRVLNIFNRYQENVPKVLRKCPEGIKKMSTGYLENVKESNTLSNPFSNTNRSIAKKKFTAPSLDEIKEHCILKGLDKVDPVVFLDYYDKNDWIDANNNPVKNWRSKLNNWNSRSVKFKTKEDKLFDDIIRDHSRPKVAV